MKWTCKILLWIITLLTFDTYLRRRYDLNCKSANVVYGLECILCGLIYVGETKGKLNKRICSHRSGIINNVNDIVYQHFDQPDHSILSMWVRIVGVSQNRRIMTSRNRKLELGTLESLLYTWILSWTDVFSSAYNLHTTFDDTAVICDRNYCRVTYLCPLYILRPPKFWQYHRQHIP